MNAQEYLEGHWMRKRVWTRLERPIHQERLRRCAEAVKGGRTFIDVGCGLGHSTAILKRFCPGGWTGVDFCEDVIAEAQKLFPDIRFLASLRGEDLPEGGHFDGVVCSEVIEHVEDPCDWVRTLWMITGKRLVVTTPCVKVHDPGHLRVFTEATLTELFKDIPGTKIERTKRFFYVVIKRGTA